MSRRRRSLVVTVPAEELREALASTPGTDVVVWDPHDDITHGGHRRSRHGTCSGSARGAGAWASLPHPLPPVMTVAPTIRTQIGPCPSLVFPSLDVLGHGHDSARKWPSTPRR